MTVGVSQGVEQEVGEVAAEHLLEPGAGRHRRRELFARGLRGLGS
jgi:hypothetical protein